MIVIGSKNSEKTNKIILDESEILEFTPEGRKYDEIIKFLINEYQRLLDNFGFTKDKYLSAIKYYKLLNQNKLDEAKELKFNYYCTNSGGYPKLPNEFNLTLSEI